MPQKSVDDFLNEVFRNRFKGFRNFLKKNKMTMLSLVKRNLGSKPLNLLSRALIGTEVSSIDLSDNRIDDEGIIAFSENLDKTPLRALNLHNNEIGDEGATAFAKKLLNGKICRVNLGFNCITVECFTALTHVFHETWFSFVDLSASSIDDKTVSVLIEKVKVSKMVLSFNEITDDGISEIIDLISQTFLTQIDLRSNNEISTEMHALLKQELSQNQMRIQGPYFLWVLPRLSNNQKLKFSRLSQKDLQDKSKRFQCGIEILARKNLPEELREMIIKMVYPSYSPAFARYYQEVFQNRQRLEQAKLLKESHAQSLPCNKKRKRQH